MVQLSTIIIKPSKIAPNRFMLILREMENWHLKFLKFLEFFNFLWFSSFSTFFQFQAFLIFLDFWIFHKMTKLS